MEVGNSAVKYTNGIPLPGGDMDASNASASAPNHDCHDRRANGSSPAGIVERNTLTPSSIITLEVRDRRFCVCLRNLIGKSNFFRSAAYTGRLPQEQADGSYFLDANGNAFEHVLVYLCDGIYPFLYDQAKGGFDYAKYTAILNLADFLGIPDLVTWIERKEYLQALTVTYRISKHKFKDDTTTDIPNANRLVASHPITRTRKVYVCPRGIFIHRGAKEKCGSACHKAKVGKPDKYEDEVVTEVVVVEEVVSFHADKCRDLMAGLN